MQRHCVQNVETGDVANLLEIIGFIKFRSLGSGMFLAEDQFLSLKIRSAITDELAPEGLHADRHEG